MAAFNASLSALRELDEERVLNVVWFSILGLEVLMIVGVIVKSTMGSLCRRPMTSGHIAL